MSGRKPSSNRDAVNQSPPFEDVDLFMTRSGAAGGGRGQWRHRASRCPLGIRPPLGQSGNVRAGQARQRERRRELKGDVVEFDPAYHRFMADSMRAGLHNMTWRADGTRAPAPAEVARAARYYMVAQVENGHMCPITMTRAAVGALALEPALAARADAKDFLARLRSALPPLDRQVRR